MKKLIFGFSILAVLALAVPATAQQGNEQEFRAMCASHGAKAYSASEWNDMVRSGRVLLGHEIKAGMLKCYQPRCGFDARGYEIKPVAVVNNAGEADVVTPDGKPLHVTGLPPGRAICKNLLFKSASRKAETGQAYLEGKRAAKFCHGLAPGHDCVHIAAKHSTK